MVSDLRSFVETLRKDGELIVVKENLSTLYEIPAALKYIGEATGRAVLFNHVEGYSLPIIGNLLGSKKRLASAFGITEERLGEDYLEKKKKTVPPHLVERGPVQEVVINKGVHLSKTLPVLTHHEKDASPYITCAITIAKDPETGMRGMGIHRIQVKDRDTIGIFLASPPLSNFFAKAEAMDRPLEIAVVLGADPVTFFSSVIWAPAGIDKFDLAGGLRKASVPLVKAKSVDLEVPANAEFVMEGKIFPHRRDKEGPFGETTGYYFTYDNPVAKIDLITHRKEPIYHALVPFSTEESILLDLSWELDKRVELQEAFPFVKRVHFANLMGLVTIVQIRKASENDAPAIIKHLFSHPFVKLIIVVDEDVDPYDPKEVEWAVATRMQPDRDVLIQADLPGLMIDPSAGGGRVSREFFSTFVTTTAKMGIDATKPLKDADRYEKIEIPERVKLKIRPIIEAYCHV